MAPVEILAAADPGVRLVANTSIEREMRRAIAPKLTWRELKDGTRRLYAWIEFKSPPTHVGFDVSIRDPATGRERMMGSVCESKGKGRSMVPSIIVSADDEWIMNAQSLEVVLRPNPEPAEATYDIVEIWDGELVYAVGPPTREP